MSLVLAKSIQRGVTRALNDRIFDHSWCGLVMGLNEVCRYWLWRPLRDRRVYPRVTYRIPVGVICQFRTTRDWERGILFVGVTHRNASFVHVNDSRVWKCNAFWKRRLSNIYWIYISEYAGIFLKVLSFILISQMSGKRRKNVRHLNASFKKRRKDAGKKFYIGWHLIMFSISKILY